MLGFSPEFAHENAIQTGRNKQVRDSDTIPELSNFCCPPAKPVVYLTEIIELFFINSDLGNWQQKQPLFLDVFGPYVALSRLLTTRYLSVDIAVMR